MAGACVDVFLGGCDDRAKGRTWRLFCRRREERIVGDGHVFAIPADIIDLAVRTSRLASQFAERRENLSNRMAAFLDGGWSGGAGTSFREAFALFDQGAKDVQQGLDLLGEKVGDGAREYQAQEQANQRGLTIQGAGGGGLNW